LGLGLDGGAGALGAHEMKTDAEDAEGGEDSKCHSAEGSANQHRQVEQIRHCRFLKS